MSENDGYESNPCKSAHGSNTDAKTGTHILIQKEVDEEIRNYMAPLIRQLGVLTPLIQGMLSVHRPRNYMAPLIRQLGVLTPLIQGMLSVHRPNLSSKPGTSADSSATGPSPDFETGDTGNSADKQREGLL